MTPAPMPVVHLDPHTARSSAGERVLLEPHEGRPAGVALSPAAKKDSSHVGPEGISDERRLIEAARAGDRRHLRSSRSVPS
jgi:hypothetical protein